LCSRGASHDARFFIGLPLGSPRRALFFLHPALGQDPAAPATAGDQQNLDPAIFGPAPGKCCHLNAWRLAADPAAETLQQTVGGVTFGHRSYIPSTQGYEDSNRFIADWISRCCGSQRRCLSSVAMAAKR